MIASQDIRPLPKQVMWVLKNPASAISILFIMLWFYQALLPKGLSFAHEAGRMAWWMKPSASHLSSRSDVISNIIAHALTCNLFFLSFRQRGWSTFTSILFSFIAVIALVLTVETIEYYNPERVSSLWDVVSAGLGGVLCVPLGPISENISCGAVRLWVQSNIQKKPSFLAAIMLTSIIFFDAFCPFHIISNASYLRDNIKFSNIIPFEPPGRDIREQLGWKTSVVTQGKEKIEWTGDKLGSLAKRLIMYSVLLAFLIYKIEGWQLIKSFTLWIGIMCITELIYLGSVGGHIDINRIVAGLMGLPFVIIGIRCSDRNPKIGKYLLLILFLCYVFISDLRPFQFDSMKKISINMFIPLLHQYQHIDVMVFTNVMQAILEYAPLGFVVYHIQHNRQPITFRQSWPPFTPAILFCGLVGAITETLQLWIPSRTPCIEGVMYAAIGGLLGSAAAQLFIYHLLLDQTNMNSHA